MGALNWNTSISFKYFLIISKVEIELEIIVVFLKKLFPPKGLTGINLIFQNYIQLYSSALFYLSEEQLYEK